MAPLAKYWGARAPRPPQDRRPCVQVFARQLILAYSQGNISFFESLNVEME